LRHPLQGHLLSELLLICLKDMLRALLDHHVTVWVTLSRPLGHPLPGGNVHLPALRIYPDLLAVRKEHGADLRLHSRLLHVLMLLRGDAQRSLRGCLAVSGGLLGKSLLLHKGSGIIGHRLVNHKAAIGHGNLEVRVRVVGKTRML
jgi:hypothetical protein